MSEQHAIDAAQMLTEAAAAMRARSGGTTIIQQPAPQPIVRETVREALPEAERARITSLAEMLERMASAVQYVTDRVVALEDWATDVSDNMRAKQSTPTAAKAPDMATATWADLLRHVDRAGSTPEQQAAVRKLDDTLAAYAMRIVAAQPRYELALQALNGSTSARVQFAPEAERRAMTVVDLAREEIDRRDAGTRWIMRAHLIRMQAAVDIDAADGTDAATICETAIEQMQEGYPWNH